MISLLGEELGVVPILRETVQTRIHRQLRDLLMRGRFQPGQPLKIQEMADLFAFLVLDKPPSDKSAKILLGAPRQKSR